MGTDDGDDIEFEEESHLKCVKIEREGLFETKLIKLNKYALRQ